LILLVSTDQKLKMADDWVIILGDEEKKWNFGHKELERLYVHQ
jgi:hypothetical protein